MKIDDIISQSAVAKSRHIVIAYSADVKNNREYVIVDGLDTVRGIINDGLKALEPYSFELGYLMESILSMRTIEPKEWQKMMELCVKDVMERSDRAKSHKPFFAAALEIWESYDADENFLLNYYAERINEEFAEMDQFYHWYYVKKKKNHFIEKFKGFVTRAMQPLDGSIKEDLFVLQSYYKNDTDDLDKLKHIDLCNYDIQVFSNLSQNNLEFMYTNDNLYALACFILRRIGERITFKECELCGKIFGSSKPYIVKYCGEACRIEAKKKDKRNYENDGKKIPYRKQANNMNQSYNNKVKKIERSPQKDEPYSITAIEKLNALKKEYQIEAKRMKQLINDGECTEEEFGKWIRECEGAASKIISEWEDMKNA